MNILFGCGRDSYFIDALASMYDLLRFTVHIYGIRVVVGTGIAVLWFVGEVLVCDRNGRCAWSWLGGEEGAGGEGVRLKSMRCAKVVVMKLERWSWMRGRRKVRSLTSELIPGFCPLAIPG